MIVVDFTKFPIYGIIVLLSVICGLLYIYKNLVKEGINKNIIFLYLFLSIVFIFSFAIIYHMVESLNFNIKHIGLSSFGGALGMLISCIVFNFIVPNNKIIIKYTILSLPLIYGLSKIACSIVGCCYGIPYDGLFSVKYPLRIDEFLFPVQITEVIVFILIFIIVNKYKNKNNIIYYTVIICAIFKFLLDFLRYDHVFRSITNNQIVSLIVIFISVIILIIKKERTLN